ncbi:TlpA family protein disulfide reductase [Formosa sp. 4Alg 33]|uniref:TlpA family protein disulfide reductase n=1 Tax=Formosa sp. 4Alg 33 TaxID=3382189 RepID=UPI003D9C0584
MKKIVIILLSTLFLTSCEEKKETKDYILLSGTISNPPSKEFRLGGKGGSTTIEIAEDGTFLDTIKTGTGKYIFFNPRTRADLYLTNGGEYNLTADGKDFRNTVKLTGTDPDASNYLMTKIDNIIKVRGDYAEFNSLNESDFIAKETAVKEQLLNYLDSFPNVPKEFLEAEREELNYYHLLTLIKYESLHQRYIKQPDFKVSPDFLKELEGIDYLNEDAYKLRSSYNKLVKEHFNRKADELIKNEGVDQHLAKLNVYGAIPNDYIKNDLLMSAASSGITYTNNLDEYYNTYISVSTSKSNDESITEKYENLKKLSKGQPSPVFTAYENYAGGTTSLSDFKGKYVYIDVWATWCGPCLAEVPALKKVEKQYHNKNIEFVSISIDVENKYDAWKKMVTDKALSGVQLLADKNWKSDFVAAYEINGIPRFILIDPSGNIVSANASRPSDSKLIELFKELGI